MSEFNISLWKKARLLWEEANWNHVVLSRENMATLLGVSDRRAGEILFALKHYDVLSGKTVDPEHESGINEAEFVRFIKQSPKSVIEVADRFDISPKAVNEMVKSLIDRHVIINSESNMLLLNDAIPKLEAETIDMRKHGSNQLVIGGIADTHIGSKYERLDVLNSLYDRFADAGVTSVFHGGNWIDGESRFNKTDIYCHGLGNQVDNFIQKYPQRKGIKTYIISGDDHEGWYVQRENINIGSFMQDQAVKAGRDDLIDAGYMERDFTLAQKHGAATLRLIHAGGGSAYAVSYTSQKYVESLQGGEKPQIILVGHYHKFEYGYPREVHTVQLGCCEDQTPFMRKRKLQAMVGGCIIRIGQSDTGIITSFSVDWMPYYDKKFYEYRW